MTINTLDGIFNALANSSVVWCLIRCPLRTPQQGSFIGCGGPQVSLDRGNSNCCGCVQQRFGWQLQLLPAVSQIPVISDTWRLSVSTTLLTLEVHDRLMHMGGLNGTLTTAQAVNLNLNGVTADNMANRIGDANYSDVQWWLGGTRTLAQQLHR